MMFHLLAFIAACIIVAAISEWLFETDTGLWRFFVPMTIGMMLGLLATPVVIDQMKEAGRVAALYEDEDRIYTIASAVISGLVAIVSGLCWEAISDIDKYKRKRLKSIGKLVLHVYAVAGVVYVISAVVLAITTNETVALNMDGRDIDITNIIFAASSWAFLIALVMSSAMYIMGLPIFFSRIFQNATVVRRLLIFISGAVVSYVLGNVLGFESKEVIALAVGSVLVVSVSIWGEV